ncbi:ABC transporter substrate-binding protein [Methylobacterium sp. P31]
MNRRCFLGCVLASPGILPLRTARANDQPVRVGWLTAQRPSSLEPYIAAFRQGLAEQGLEEGRNLTIEYRYGNDDLSRVPDLANQLAKAEVAVILAQGAAVTVLSKLNLPIPVIYAFSGDPVSAGLASSYARPSRNMTGVTFMAAELNKKRLEFLREIVPGLRRVALIGNPEHPGEQLERSVSLDAGRQFDLSIDYYPTKTSDALTDAFTRLAADPPQALSVFADGFTLQNRVRLIDFANQLRIPVISGWPVFAQAGAICTYGPRLTECYRRLAAYLSRVTKGEQPGSIPIERPATFELVLNLKAAKALGINVPASVLALADQVIE